MSQKNVSAQVIDSVKLDTLISVLTLEKEDVRTVNAYLSLSQEYIGVTDYSIALTYATLARDLSKKIDHTSGELDALFLLAHVYEAYYQDFENAIKYYDDALILAEAIDSKEDIITVYRGYSQIYAFNDRYPLAIQFNEESINIAKELGDNPLVSDLTAYGGSLYEENGDTAKAIELYEEVERIEEESNYLNTSNAALTSIAHLKFLQGDLENSLRMYRSAIKKFERLRNFRWTAFAHAEIAKVYIVEGDYEMAEKHAARCLELSQKYELNKERLDSYQVLALVYGALGNEEKAKAFQDSFSNLKDSIRIKLDERELKSFGEDGQNSSNECGLYAQIPSLVIILFLTVLFVLLSGLRRKKS